MSIDEKDVRIDDDIAERSSMNGNGTTERDDCDDLDLLGLASSTTLFFVLLLLVVAAVLPHFRTSVFLLAGGANDEMPVAHSAKDNAASREQAQRIELQSSKVLMK